MLFGFTSTESKAFIELSEANGITNITAKFANAASDAVTYDYLLSVTKKGRNGEASGAQGGQFSAAAGETVTLSSQSVNFDASDAIELKLEVLDANERVLFEDTWKRVPEKSGK